ncbi:MAG TPA: winged helix-turn-helix domain-containing protein [Hyphomonas sp.]|nr:winged helix-turn-helix domain-containing protein [Hyphomonas sp.]MCA8905387.1 winged helix-turn-helix domain-containing protein [Hyphomonas sp.]MCB9972177.1 winged helix-turn-helix domain-containing protein [Hyphomonas sp.]HPE49386.1 winged helix-turn-helix domain-containing protein [Hyphomonas sp.]
MTTDPGEAQELWIGTCRVDPAGLRVYGPNGDAAVEPKVMEVLQVLAAHPGKVVPRSDLLEQVWATEYGGDESLTRAISLLRKAFEDVHGDRNFIRTIPRRGYSLVAIPEAADPVDAGRQAGFRASHRRGPVIAAIAAAGLAVLAFASHPWSKPAANPPFTMQSIAPVAVGTFAVASPEPDVEEAAVASPGTIRQELLRNGIPVATPNSSNGRQAAFRLSGTISSRNGGARTNLQLVHSPSGQVVWAASVDVGAGDLVNLTDIVANRAAQVLRCADDVAGLIPTGSLDAVAAYFRFCASTAMADWNEYISFTRSIYESDPDNPNARAFHALSLAAESIAITSLPPADRTARAAEALQVATDILRTDPDNPVANQAMAWLAEKQGDWLTIESYLARPVANDLLPADMRAQYGFFLRRVGRNRDAIETYRAALAAQPAQTMLRVRLGWLLASLGDFRDANEQFAYIDRTDPDWPEYRIRKDQIAWFYDDPATALRAMDTAQAAGPPDTFQTCMRHFLEAKLSGTSDVGPVVDSCATIQPDYRLRIYTQLGQLDLAFAQSTDVTSDPTNGWEIVLFYPDMASFRRDPRFWDVVAKLGLANYWLTSGHWPDFCSDRDLPEPCETAARRAQTKLASAGANP